MKLIDEQIYKEFRELFFSNKGTLKSDDFSYLRRLFKKDINFIILFKELSRSFYKDELNKNEKNILENSPWFMKLKVNLKYPTNRSERESLRLNNEWLLFLLEDKKTFLIYRKEKDERDYKYITEHSVNYGVLDYDVYKDFLVILSEDKFLRVIYLWTLREVYERKNENIKGLYVSGNDLIIEYEGICQKAEILEGGEIDFRDFVKGKEEREILGIGSNEVVAFKLIKTLEGHSNDVNSVSFSPDGKFLASGSRDKTIKIWEVGSWELIKTLEGHSGSVYSVSFSPDGKFLASGSRDETIKIWEVGSWKLIETLYGHSYSVYSVSFSPNRKFLASGGGSDKTIKIWEVGSWKLIKTLYGHSYSVRSVSFSPDGKFLASGSGDETIKIWEVGSWKLIKTLEGHSYSVYSVSSSPDGKFLASGSGDKTIKIWEVGSWELIKTLEGHSYSVYSASSSPDGKFLVSGSWDKTIKIWEVGSWKLIKTLKGHSSGVLSVSFSPNGKYLASGGSDGLIRIWEFSLVSSYNDIKLVKALYYLYKKPNLFFYCEDKSIRSWSENKNEFEFSALIGENVEKVPDDYNEIKDFEVWIIDNDFIIIKDNKVCGSENFTNYINVLLGADLDNYLNFEEFLKLNIKEVIK
jgi:WD40 repeat protein